MSEQVLANAPETLKPRNSNELLNFMRVSPVQQVGAMVSTCATLSLLSSTHELAKNLTFQMTFDSGIGMAAIILSMAALGLNVGAFGFQEALAVGKYMEYRKIKQSLIKYGWDERIIEPKLHSWCQRNAARAAAIDTGYVEKIDALYEQRGYKWYHFLPDAIAGKPKPK